MRTGMQRHVFKTPSAMYDASFELCLRHLHMQEVPLHEACNVQRLLENRATHALGQPGRYVPAINGSVSTLTPPLEVCTHVALDADGVAMGLAGVDDAHGACNAEDSAVGLTGVDDAPEADTPEDVQCFVLWPRTADMQDLRLAPPVDESVITQPEVKHPEQPVAKEPVAKQVTTPKGTPHATRRQTHHNARWGYHADRHARKRHRANGHHVVWQPRIA